MNRHQKRAKTAQAKCEAQRPERGDYLDMAMRALAGAANTAAGATLILPTGETSYITRADADAWAAASAPGAVKQ